MPGPCSTPADRQHGFKILPQPYDRRHCGCQNPRDCRGPGCRAVTGKTKEARS